MADYKKNTNPMEQFENIMDSFIDYLKQFGYPDERIALEWGDRKSAVDIAILADDLITPISFYEIKIRKNLTAVQTGVNQLKRVVQRADISVPCYLVFRDSKEVGFEIIDVSDVVLNNDSPDIKEWMDHQKPTKPVSYHNIQAGAASKAISRAANKKQRKIDRFKFVCWLVIPLVAAVLLVVDACGIYEITILRLAVFGAVVIIVLLPFFSEISLKDVTLKRKGKD